MSWAEVSLRPDRIFGVRDDRHPAIHPSSIANYYDACSRARLSDPYFRLIAVELSSDPAHGSRVRTSYIPLYRVHETKYFHRGDAFGRNWESSDRKRHRADRYSPFGTEGHYFSLTLLGAENEAQYYGNGSLPVGSSILVLDVYLDDILDLLSGQIAAVWRRAGLDADTPLHQMYLAIMDPSTDNPATNAIGQWARKQQGLTGIIYPSARYGQLDWVARGVAEGLSPVPLINRVTVGSPIDRSPFMNVVQFAHNVIHAHEMPQRGQFPVSAEANLVLFDGAQLVGRDRAVFYQLGSFQDRAEIEAEDDRGRQQNFLIRFGSGAWFDAR